MKTIAVTIALTLFACAQPSPEDAAPAEPSYVPTFPVPTISNEYVDSSAISNGDSYWKTTMALNSKIYVHSGSCELNGRWERDHAACKAGGATVIDTQPVQVYRLNIGQLREGDVYQILSQFELTNDLTYGVMVGDTVMLSTNADDTDKWSLPFRRIVPTNGTNCFPSTHHCTETKVGSFLVTAEIAAYAGNSDVWVIVLAWSNVSLSKLSNGDAISIEKHLGSLSVIKSK